MTRSVPSISKATALMLENSEAATRFTALGNETRLTIYRWLLPFNPVGRAFGEIAQGLGLADATLAFHLKEMAHAGLIQSRPEGRKVIYSVNIDTVSGLVEFLLENCCAGTPCTPRQPAKAAAKSKRKQPSQS